MDLKIQSAIEVTNVENNAVDLDIKTTFGLRPNRSLQQGGLYTEGAYAGDDGRCIIAIDTILRKYIVACWESDVSSKPMIRRTDGTTRPVQPVRKVDYSTFLTG